MIHNSEEVMLEAVADLQVVVLKDDINVVDICFDRLSSLYLLCSRVAVFVESRMACFSVFVLINQNNSRKKNN